MGGGRVEWCVDVLQDSWQVRLNDDVKQGAVTHLYSALVADMRR